MLQSLKLRQANNIQEGFALVPVVFMLALLGVFAFISTRETATTAAMTENEMQKDSNISVTDAAMEHAKWLAQSNNCELPTNRAGIGFAGGSYDLQFNGSPSAFTITSTTTNRHGEQTVEVLEDQILYDHANSRLLDVAVAADAYLNLRPGKEFDNKGDANDMHLNSKSTELEYPVLRFDLSSIPSTAKLVSGILNLAVKANGGLQETVQLHRLTTQWQEGDVSSAEPWIQNGGDYDATPSAQFEITQPGTKSVDITPLASEWISGKHENFGLILRLEATAVRKHMTLHAKESGKASEYARVSVSYVCPCGQSCNAGVVIEDFMLATDTEASLLGQSFEAKDLMLVSRAKSEIEYELEGAFNSFSENITAVHKLSNNRYLMSFANTFTPAGTVFEPQDLVEYDATTKVFRTFIDGSAIGIVDNISSVSVTLDGRVVISLDKEADVFGTRYQSNDLFVVDTAASTSSLFFDGAEHSVDKDISGAHIFEDGNIVLSFNEDTSVDSVTAYAGDLIYFDTVAGTARLYFSGSAFEASEVIQAVHIGEGMGNINRMEAHFPFNEGSGAIARDVVGSRSASIIDSPLWKPGGWQGALGFDGAGGALQLASDSGLVLDRSFTTMLWLLSESGSVGEQIVMSKADGANEQSFMLGFDAGQFNWSLSNSMEDIRMGPFPGLADGSWNHIAMVFDADSDTATTYINGAVANVFDTAFEPEANTNNFLIGSGWKGVLDELIVYNYALTGIEIEAEASKSLSGPDAPPAYAMEMAYESRSDDAVAFAIAESCEGGVADFFDSKSYANSNGTVAWNDNWMESSDDNDAFNGNVKISGSGTSSALSFSGEGSAAVYRKIPLYGATKMTMSFDTKSAWLGSGDTLRVRVSPNGPDGDWQEIDQLDSSYNSFSTTRKEYDITSAAGSDTYIAFESSGYNSGWKSFTIDNILIRCTQ
ncbi:MAG: LamG-like jellyroll fold domain-containing protein [Pseudomonadales bacterium]